MGIRTRNLQNYLIQLKYSQTIAATVNADCAMVPFAGHIGNICATVCQTGGGAADAVIDLNLNGTTIYGGATKLTVDATTGVVTQATLTANPTNVNAGDVLSMDIDTASAAIDTIVGIMITRSGVGEFTQEIDQDEVT